MTGDKKKIQYNNVSGRYHGASKMNHHQPHQMPIFIQRWWCVHGGTGRDELLLEHQMIHSNNDYSQLDQLKAALNEKHPKFAKRKHIVFHQDNASFHVSLMTRQKLLKLGWEVLIHPPYSLDTAPSNFHLFWSLQTSFKEKISIPWCKKAPGTILCSKR